MNLEYLYFEPKDQEIRKFAPTILKFLMEEEIIEEEFLIGWIDKKEELIKQMKEHFLWSDERDERFREIVKQFTEWLKEEEEEDDEGD